MAQHRSSAPDTCRNCGNYVAGNYCSNCGQQSHLPHDSFLHLIGHFFADYFHYDGKFLSTLKLLLMRPGALTREYIKGRRVAFLNPIQLYVFISAIFFLIFSQAIHIQVVSDQQGFNMETHVSFRHHNYVHAHSDTTIIGGMAFGSRKMMDFVANDSTAERPAFSRAFLLDFGLRLLPRYAHYNHLYNMGDALTQVAEIFLHSISKLFFFLMPLMALLMKWGFRRKDLLFTDYAVMSIHYHAFVFINFMLIVILIALPFKTHQLFIVALALVQVAYFIIACKQVYGYSHNYTISISLIICFLYICSLALAALLNLIAVLKFG